MALATARRSVARRAEPAGSAKPQPRILTPGPLKYPPAGLEPHPSQASPPFPVPGNPPQTSSPNPKPPSNPPQVQPPQRVLLIRPGQTADALQQLADAGGMPRQPRHPLVHQHQLADAPAGRSKGGGGGGEGGGVARARGKLDQRRLPRGRVGTFNAGTAAGLFLLLPLTAACCAVSTCALVSGLDPAGCQLTWRCWTAGACWRCSSG